MAVQLGFTNKYNNHGEQLNEGWILAKFCLTTMKYNNHGVQNTDERQIWTGGSSRIKREGDVAGGVQRQKSS